MPRLGPTGYGFPLQAQGGLYSRLMQQNPFELWLHTYTEDRVGGGSWDGSPLAGHPSGPQFLEALTSVFSPRRRKTLAARQPLVQQERVLPAARTFVGAAVPCRHEIPGHHRAIE